MLAIVLCERYGGYGSISPTEQNFYKRMIQLLPEGMSWWCLYLGRVAAVLAEVYPAGKIVKDRVTMACKVGIAKGKKTICLNFEFGLGLEELDESLQSALKKVEKAGKKKNWIDGVGHKVSVTVNGNDLVED